jgi:hypothetical protein
MRPAIIGGMLAASTFRSDAQVIPTREIVMPPWNAQHVFEPTPLPQLADQDSAEVLAPEDTPVKTRVHPDYAARGVRAGDWMFNPTLYAGALYNSNVFASPSNQQSDIVTQVGAGLGAQTLWGRHGINVSFGAISTLYGHHSGLNQTDANFTTTGHFDIDHSTQLLGAINASYLHVGVGTLTSPTGAVEPTPYTHLSGDLALRKEFGRVTTAFGTRVESYSYGSTIAPNGSIINQDSRNGQIYTVYGRTDYAFSEKSAFFTSVEGNWRDLQGTPTQSLESDGYRALAGFNLEFTHLIKGEFAAGYLKQHFFASSIGNIEGPAYRAMLTWSPSRSVDVHFNAEQTVTEVSDTTASGVLANAVQLGVDYEFRPNIVVLTAATFEKDRFQGQTREDNVYALDARIRYALNNVTSISLQYRYTRRDSNAPDASYDQHLVGVNASAHF